MGKKIDGFVLSILMAICLYLYFLQISQNNVFSLIAAFVCCLILSRLFRRIGRQIGNSRHLQKRRYCRQAGSVIMELACADRAVTLERLKSLLKKTFQEEYALELIQAHPCEKLAANSVFCTWKQHRGDEKLVLCATCICEAEVRMMAQSLRAPRIAIIDSERLKQLMAEYPMDFQLNPSRKASFRRFATRLRLRILNRRNAPRCILFGVFSLVLYVFSGNVLYLPSAMFLFLVAVFSFRQPSASAKLF